MRTVPDHPPAGEYALATGEAVGYRLQVLHELYGPGTRRVLLDAGIAARILSLKPDLKPFEIKTILYWMFRANGNPTG